MTLFATLQNAVGSGGAGNIQGVRFGGYGGNRNRVMRENAMVAVAMDKSADPVASGPVKVRNASGAEVPGAEMLWLAGVSGLSPQAADPLARIAAQGGVVLADGVSAGFFSTLAKLRNRRTRPMRSRCSRISRGKTYEGWTITGTAFGKGPSHGTEASQQPVTGFAGQGLVNTFQGGDGPQGTATSKPFTIERRYIGFLIGGGNHPRPDLHQSPRRRTRWSAPRPARTARPWSRPAGTWPI